MQHSRRGHDRPQRHTARAPGRDHHAMIDAIETVGLQRVQTGVACVEWFPYHSERFRRLRLLLPSQAYGFSLVARAVDRGAVIVLMRSRALWLNSVAGLASADVLELKVPRSA